MATQILTPDAIRLRIKAATRDLVKLCGGVERAAELAGCSDTQVSRWQSTSETTTMPLPAIVVLEADAGVPVVTSALAHCTGHRVVGCDAMPVDRAASVLAHFATVARAAAGLQSTMADAVSDFHLTPAEAETLTRAAGELIAFGHRFQSHMANVKSRGGVDLRSEGCA